VKNKLPPLEDFLKKTWVVETEGVKVLKGERPNTVKMLNKNGETFEVVPKKPFPISYPYFLIFTDLQGNEILMVEDYRKMDEESRKSLEEILDKLYFMPRIKKVKKLETSGDEFVWVVETDRGQKEFRTRGRRSISRTGEKIVIVDTNDNVYTAEDLSKMDRKSRELLESVT
jgi:tRNA G10  N-methylase Trm11